MNYSRLFAGIVLWACIISLTISGAVAMSSGVASLFVEKPWYEKVIDKGEDLIEDIGDWIS